jgi:hypothetical protein
MQGDEELRSALVRALMECDRLSRLLKAEQTAHSQTRQALTSALGDTVDLLTKERSTRKQATRKPAVSAVPAASNGGAGDRKAEAQTELKTPSLELPQLD